MFYVEIVRFSDEEVVQRLSADTESKAERIDRGVNINLNHAEYFTRIVESE